MFLDSTSERQPLSKVEEETFPIPTTIHDFDLKMEPFGFDDGVWDVQPSLGSLQPPNSITAMSEDFPCCYNLNGEESGFGDDAVDTDIPMCAGDTLPINFPTRSVQKTSYRRYLCAS